MKTLELHVGHFASAHEWDWRLQTPEGDHLAYHEARLDPHDELYGAFSALDSKIRRSGTTRQQQLDLVDELGRWIADEVLGEVGTAIVQATQSAPLTVRVVLTPEARVLAYRPLELARIADRPLALSDISLVYELDAGARIEKAPVGERLRVLAVFSIPTGVSVLDLRRERHELQRILRRYATNRGRGLKLRVLQYGATRELVREAFEEGGGWDVVHFACHGEAGGIVLEKTDGTRDPVSTHELLSLMESGRHQLKLVTLSACDSAAATAAETLHQLGLGKGILSMAAPAEPALPAVAQELVTELGCAAVAMRYRVDDDFAIQFTDHLYATLLERENELPRSMQLSLSRSRDGAWPPHWPGTPALFGATALGLRIQAPPGRAEGLPSRISGFPEEAKTFVGRVGALARASEALAPDSSWTGVLFCGMAGAGKTACAVEVSYRYQHDRFTAMAWYKAPEEGLDISTSLADFCALLEQQLGFEMAAALRDRDRFKNALSDLTSFLDNHSVLLVLDNLESLLSSRRQWKDPRWGDVIEALCAHGGYSRVILTSRLEPDGLSPKVRAEAISSLSLAESALLARRLPHLGSLMDEGTGGRDLVTRTLRLMQGNPKLIVLADAQADDPARLAELLGRSEQAWEASEGQLETFFEAGKSAFEPEAFLNALYAWTGAVAELLDDASRVVFELLCSLEETDRLQSILDDRLDALWARIAPGKPLSSPEESIAPLLRQGLVERDEDEMSFRIHPAVAEAGRELAGDERRRMIDEELAEYWKALFWVALGDESGRGDALLRAGAQAAPYLLRLGEFRAAGALLEQVIARETSALMLELVIPHLQRIVDASTGGEAEVEARGTLAKALTHVRPQDAQPMLAEGLEQAVAAEDYELASGLAGDLINLYRRNGLAEQALDLALRKREYSERAGLGPWTCWGDDSWRLQLLADEEEVLAAARQVLEDMETTPRTAGDDEAVAWWYAREAVLDAARSAALSLGRWQEALDFSAAVAESKRGRTASQLSCERTRFNDYGPLIGLGRVDSAATLLESCQRSFERARYARGRGSVLGGLAHIAYARGDHAEAARRERNALLEKYAADGLGSIALSHHNLGLYLGPAGAPHLLAAALLRTEAKDRGTTATLTALHPVLKHAPGTFAALCEALGEGFDLQALWVGAPVERSDADEAIAAVCAAAAAPPEAGRRPSPGPNQIPVWIRHGRSAGWLRRHVS